MRNATEDAADWHRRSQKSEPPRSGVENILGVNWQQRGRPAEQNGE